MRIRTLEVIKGADRGQSCPGMIFGQLERHALEARKPLPVAVRILSLEWCAAQSLSPCDFERATERERSPRDYSPVTLGDLFNLERGEIGVARSKVEPEFDWQPAVGYRIISHCHPLFEG